MTTRRTVLAGAAAAAALGLAGRPGRAPGAAAAPDRFRVGFQKSAAILVALHRRGNLEKRLEELGVGRVEWVEFQFGPPMLEALGAGAIDIGYVGDTPPIFAQAAGAPLVYAACATATCSGILVREDAPLRTVADLAGKRVALAKGSSAHSFTVLALKRAGLGFGDIRPHYLAPADAVAAFATGAVDAWTVWDPYLALAQGRHGGRLLTSSELDPALRSNSFYLANRDFAEAWPGTLDAALQEIAAVTRWAAGDLDGLADLAAAATGVDPQAQRIAVGRQEIDLRPVTPATLAAQQAIADAFHALGLIPRAVDVAGYALDRTPAI